MVTAPGGLDACNACTSLVVEYTRTTYNTDNCSFYVRASHLTRLTVVCMPCPSQCQKVLQCSCDNIAVSEQPS